MRPLRKIVLHASGKEQDSAQQIDRRHRRRGLRGIGFHYVIREDGTFERGRELRVPGAHCLGFNADSVGICLCGRGKASEFQYRKLLRLLRKLKTRAPRATLVRVGELDAWSEDPLTLNMTLLREVTGYVQ